jgi:predicted  nucleic acid-binding Zn-ribbon protein
MTTKEFLNMKHAVALEKLKIRINRAERRITEALMQVTKVDKAITSAQAKITLPVETEMEVAAVV